MGHCSVPRWFGIKPWFDKRFSDICDAHDERYKQRRWWPKWRADVALSIAMAKRGYALLCAAALLVNFTLGTLYFVVKKYKNG